MVLVWRDGPGGHSPGPLPVRGAAPATRVFRGRLLLEAGFSAPTSGQFYEKRLGMRGVSRLSSAGKYTSVTTAAVHVSEHARHSAALRLTSAGTRE